MTATTPRTATPGSTTPGSTSPGSTTPGSTTPGAPPRAVGQPFDRRTVLAAGASVVGVGLLAACGSGSGASSGGGVRATPGGPLVALADVPVGGAVAVTTSDGVKVVVAQPAAGQVVAFSAICAHQGCAVTPDGDRLNCPCHGSVFEAFTGAVVTGPAEDPLPAYPVTLDGDAVVEA